MSNTIYFTTITEIGSSVNDMLEEGMLIIFKDNVPEELAQYCVLHSENELYDNIRIGDVLKINNYSYKVTSIGDAVNENLKSLGHITIRFDGAEKSELPGTLSVENKEIKGLQVGNKLSIER